MSGYNLSKEDFDFLIDLQHEMLTQDHVGQASPRFWTVATEKYQELGTEDCFDGTNLYSSDDAEIVCDGDLQSVAAYVLKQYSEELDEKDIVLTDEGHYWSATSNKGEETFYSTRPCCRTRRSSGLRDILRRIR